MRGSATWNYAVVHVHGLLRFIDDSAWVRAHVEALTHEHEANRDTPWAVTDAPAEFVDKLVTAVVGLEISITRWYGKWKVSQNRSAADRVGVIEGLEGEASASSVAMAALIKQTLSEDESSLAASDQQLARRHSCRGALMFTSPRQKGSTAVSIWPACGSPKRSWPCFSWRVHRFWPSGRSTTRPV